MLNVQASGTSQFCDRIHRRQALQIGALGTMGLGLTDWLAHPATAATGKPKTFGSAKHVILFFMWGGPAHQETWDLKPDGPSATRGEFLPIATNVPGIHISEHLPLVSRHADKLAIIRSVGQEDNNHSTGAHAGLTGRRHDLKAENFGARETDFPHIGSVLSKLHPAPQGMPTFVSMPDIIATTAGAVVPGQDGGMIGKKYDPFRINDHPERDDFQVPALQLPSGMNTSRLAARRSLLSQVEEVARVAERSTSARSMENFYQQALDMVLSPQARRAFDLEQESDETRWRYGWHTFGQSTLLARRLIESGVKLVTVYWHREKAGVDSSWDTHRHNFQEMKNRLLPSVDRPLAALFEDLSASGLLDETLIVWNSEFGRTPKINKYAGRDHWGPCNSVVLAGAGVPGGQVFGASDAQAAYPTRDKVTQDNIAATIYHLLGIEPETPIHDRLGRPFPVALGEPIQPLLGGECPAVKLPDPAAREKIPHLGSFTRMLMERGGRFLTVDLGNSDSESEWKLAGFGQPSGEEPWQFRPLAEAPGTLEFLGHYPANFDYSTLAVRLAQPVSLAGVQIQLGSQTLSISEELQNQEPQRLWQFPLPTGMAKSLSTLQIEITAPAWQVCDVAILGDPIHERFQTGLV